MKDSTRSILRYSRDILIILIVLVVLARSGNMPVIVPDKVTDFIIDATQDLFSGKIFSSFSGFLSDVGDFFLQGGSDKQNRKLLERYRGRLEQYFERSGRNLLHLAAHPDVRRALPDFQSRFGTLYASGVLQDMLDGCFDLDQMSLHTDTGALLARVLRPGTAEYQPGEAFAHLRTRLRTLRGVLIEPLPDRRILVAAEFASRMRERQGLLLMVLNGRGIAALLEDVADPEGFLLYLTDRTGGHYAASPARSGYSREFLNALGSGKYPVSLLREEKYQKLPSGTRRSYLVPLRLPNSENAFYIGLLGPEGNVLSFVLLLLRMLLLIAVLVVLLYLVRRILGLSRGILRNRKLQRRMLELSLEKSLAAGSRAGEAAGLAVKATRHSTEAMERAVLQLKETAAQPPALPPPAESVKPPAAAPPETAPPLSRRKAPTEVPAPDLLLDPEGYRPPEKKRGNPP